MYSEGKLLSYEIQTMSVTMKDCNGNDKCLQLRDIADDDLVKALLRLNWQYSDMNLKLRVDCPVKYREEKKNSEVVNGKVINGSTTITITEACMPLKAQAPEELEVGWYIKTGPLNHDEGLVRYVSRDPGGHFSPGPNFGEDALVDPGLARFLQANASCPKKWWIQNNVRVNYIWDQEKRNILCVFRHPDEDGEGRLKPFEKPEEQALFEQWREMLLNGTELYSEELFQAIRKGRDIKEQLLEAINAEMEKFSVAREGAVATSILDKYWRCLADEAERAGIWERFADESPDSVCTKAALLLKMALDCCQGDYSNMLRNCSTANMNLLGYQLSVLLGKADAAYRFAEQLSYEESGTASLERLAKVTRSCKNFEALFNWLGRYFESIDCDNLADESSFFLSCYKLLQELRQDAGISANESAGSSTAMERLTAIDGMKEYLAALQSGTIEDDETREFFREMDTYCSQLANNILQGPVDTIIKLADELHEQLTAPVQAWDQLWQDNPKEAANVSRTNIYDTLREVTREAMQASPVLAVPEKTDSAKPIVTEPEPTATAEKTPLERVRERFQKDGQYRLPTETDRDMLQVLKALLEQETDVTTCTMPLLIYVSLADMEPAKAAVESYQEKIRTAQSKKRKPPEKDRRWQLSVAMHSILDRSDCGAVELKDNEKPFFEALQGRYRK